MQRARLFRSAPRHLVASGVAWLVFGIYLLVAGVEEWAQESGALHTLISPALGLASLIGGFGLISRRPFARGVIVFIAGLGLLTGLVGLHLLSQPLFAQSWASPERWVVVTLCVFFAWSLVLVIFLWPARPVPKPAAG